MNSQKACPNYKFETDRAGQTGYYVATGQNSPLQFEFDVTTIAGLKIFIHSSSFFEFNGQFKTIFFQDKHALFYVSINQNHLDDEKKLGVKYIKNYIASSGNRTRAARVAGEHSTTEPTMLCYKQYIF